MKRWIIAAILSLSLPAGAISAPVVELAAFGAIPNDGLDDRAAFDAAIVKATASGASHVLHIPCGTFDVGMAPVPGAAIWLISIRGLTIRGEGECTVIRELFPSPVVVATQHLFYAEYSSGIRFQDLVLDGNLPYMTSGPEQMHLVNMLDAGDFTFDHVLFRDSWGDAIKMIGFHTELVVTSIDDAGARTAVVATMPSTSAVVLGTAYDITGTTNYNARYVAVSKTSTTVTFDAPPPPDNAESPAAENGGETYAITSIDDDADEYRSIKIHVASAALLHNGSSITVTGTVNFNGDYMVVSAGTDYVVVEQTKFGGAVAAEVVGTVTHNAALMTSKNGRVNVDHCRVSHMNRDGFTFHAYSSDVVVSNTIFEKISDQAIDFESGAGAQRVLFSRNFFYNNTAYGRRLIVALSGGDQPPLGATHYISFIGNYVEGYIDMVRTGQTQIEGNTIRSGDQCLDVSRYSHGSIITGNHFECNMQSVAQGSTGSPGIVIASTGGAAIHGPADIVFANNEMVLDEAASLDSFALSILGGEGRVIIANNTWTSLETSTVGTIAISYKNTLTDNDTRGLVVQGNIFNNFAEALRLAYAPGPIDDVVFDSNIMESQTVTGSKFATCAGTAAPRSWLNITSSNIPARGTTAAIDSGCYQIITIADDGTGAAATDTTAPETGSVLAVCNDTNGGCAYTPATTYARANRSFGICNSTSNSMTVAHSTTVFTLGLNDCARCTYSPARAQWVCEGPVADGLQ